MLTAVAASGAPHAAEIDAERASLGCMMENLPEKEDDKNDAGDEMQSCRCKESDASRGEERGAHVWEIH